MRNKSRKRILHEQRVEIAKLRRIIKSYPRYRPSPEIVTLRRDFLVPLNVRGGDTIRDHEAYKTMKEIMQRLVNLLEIRYEDVPALHSGKYTVILRAVRPSISQIDPEAFMRLSQGGSICEELLKKPEPLIGWFPSDDEAAQVLFGGTREGGRKFYETHVLGNFKAKDGEG